MNTISINSDIYKKAEVYAKLHNISVSEAMERALTLLLGKMRHAKGKSIKETDAFKKGLAYVKTLPPKGGRPVPANENGLDALIEMKYEQ